MLKLLILTNHLIVTLQTTYLSEVLTNLMIDRIARDKAAEVVRHFVTGHIYNFDFQDTQPDSEDPIIVAIWDSLWPFYCDISKHKMNNEWQLPEEGKHKIAIWLLFLYSDEEYKWPKISYPGSRPMSYNIFQRMLGCNKKQDNFFKSGNFELWPFIDEESFLLAKNNPRLLSGGL